MSFSLRPFILTAFALAISGLPAYSQLVTQFVQGIVTDADGKVVMGALVSFDTDEAAKGVYIGIDGVADVTHKEDSKHAQAKPSDKKGHYIAAMPPGIYTVTVTVDGKVRAIVKQYEVVRTGSNDPLDFKLKAGGVIATSGPGTASKPNKEADDKAAKEREAKLAKDKELNDSFAAGKAALEAKQWDEAVTQLTKASEIGPTQQAVWAALAEAYVGSAKGAKGAEAGSIYDKSFAAFDKVLTLTPDDAGTYNNYALALAADKRLDDAKVKMAKAVELDPAGGGRYHYNLGALLMDNNQTDGAVEEFKKSFTADPNYAESYFYYGSTIAQGRRRWIRPAPR